MSRGRHRCVEGPGSENGSSVNPRDPANISYRPGGEAGIGDAILECFLCPGGNAARADLLDLELVHENDPLCLALRQAAATRGLTVVTDSQGDDTILRLFGPWEEFQKSLSKNLITSTARKWRQLQRAGNLTYGVIAEPLELQPALEECYELETKGWKGVAGSPIRSSPQTLRFYTELAMAEAAVGRSRCPTRL